MIKLVYDCLRSPYDFANIIQVSLATGACELHITGNSLRHDHPKVYGKVMSWSSKVKKDGLTHLQITYYETLEECISKLKSQGVKVIGTSPYSSDSFYDLNLNDNYAIVFGTESSGLTKAKQQLLDGMVKIPMKSDLDFMTLSVVTPIVVYEALRQSN